MSSSERTRKRSLVLVACLTFAPQLKFGSESESFFGWIPKLTKLLYNMDLILLFCFIFASPVFGDGIYSQNTNPAEFDRARSAWNFGGHSMKNRHWGRPKNIAGPGSVIANRRMGDQMRTNAWTLPSTASRKTYTSASSIRSRQSKPSQKPIRSHAKKPHNKFLKSTDSKNSSLPIRSTPLGYQGYHAMNSRQAPKSSNGGGKKSGLPKTMSSLRNRGSQTSNSRRKRNTDQQLSSAIQDSAQFQQIFDINSRMSTADDGLRRHFGKHFGGGKNQRPTVIAPPKFDKTDILEMLLGSGGVNPNEMGTVLATNGRYVRFGRGLGMPNSVRGGRALWFSDLGPNSIRNLSPQSASNYPQVKTQPQQQPQGLAASVPSPAPTPTITIHSTPTISVTPQVTPTATVAAPSAPLILNVQIAQPAPLPARVPPPTPSVPNNVASQPQTLSQPQPQRETSYSTVSSSPNEKSKKMEHFKLSDYTKPVAKNQRKPQKAPSYNHDHLNNYGTYETSSSKVQKVKSNKKKNKKKNKSKYYNYDHSASAHAQSYSVDSNDFYNYPSPNQYYESSNPLPDSHDLSSQLDYYNGKSGSKEYTEEPTTANLKWNDNENIITIPQSLSLDLSQSDYFSNSGPETGFYFAVKTQPVDNYDSLNNVYDIGGATVMTYSDDDDEILDGASISLSDRKRSLQTNSYSYGTEDDEMDLDESRKYYIVKKPQIQDPIIVHVPKD